MSGASDIARSAVVGRTARSSTGFVGRLPGRLRRATSLALRLPMSALRPGSIAMFHVGRSGSTVLGDLLNQHPKILWDGEIYDPFVRGWALGALMKPGDLGLDPIRVLRKRRIRAGARYYGFETKFFHLRLMEVGLPEYVRDLRHNGVDRFVVLERRNYLRKVVSAAVAHERAAFSRAAHDERPRPSRIRLDTEELRIEFSSEPLLAYLEDYREGFARLRELLPEERTLWLTYEEDLSSDPARGYERVCRFVGLEPCPVAVRYGKTNPHPLSEIVDNLEEVERALGGTRYEWMLYE